MKGPGRNERCPCLSGRKYKRCCGELLNARIWLYDHPALPHVLETLAENAEHALRSFRAEWEKRAREGTIKGDVSLTFQSGRIYRDGETVPPPAAGEAAAVAAVNAIRAYAIPELMVNKLLVRVDEP